jgi:hypothetical protein
MGSTRQPVRSLLGAVTLSLAVGGCASQHDDTLRLTEELGRARGRAEWERAQAAEAEARAALLEARVARLEQRATESRTGGVEESRLVRRLDRLLEVTELLMDERRARVASPAEAQGPGEADTKATAVGSADTKAPLTATQEQQLRALVEVLLTSPGNSQGLTRDQERTLRSLLRWERKLDTRNPWPSALR